MMCLLVDTDQDSHSSAIVLVGFRSDEKVADGDSEVEVTDYRADICG